MAFIEKKDPVVLNIKLTSKGRELLSKGKLTFSYFGVGDSEIDYAFNSAAQFNPFYSNILRPADKNPQQLSFITRELSGETLNEIGNVPCTPTTVENQVDPVGFFEANATTFLTDTDHVKQPDIVVNISGVTGGTTLMLNKAPYYQANPNEPAVGDLLLVKWTNPEYVSGNTTGYTVNSSYPTPYLFYKIQDIVSGSLAGDNLVVEVDRDLPDFSSLSASTNLAGAMVYYNFINYTGDTCFSTDETDDALIAFLQNCQCPTVTFPFWNMSIIFTENIVGIKPEDKQFGEYNSVGLGGFVSYIQNQAPVYRNLGVIHYTNPSVGNTYGEGFYGDPLNIEDVNKIPKLDIPVIMWHKSSGTTLGVRLKATGGLKYLTGVTKSLNTRYYDLADNLGNVVGKVFYDLKIFVIEDQELLFAMSYKSNRSWTLPNYGVDINANVTFGCPDCVLTYMTMPSSPSFLGGNDGGLYVYNIQNNLGNFTDGQILLEVLSGATLTASGYTGTTIFFGAITGNTLITGLTSGEYYTNVYDVASTNCIVSGLTTVTDPVSVITVSGDTTGATGGNLVAYFPTGAYAGNPSRLRVYQSLVAPDGFDGRGFTTIAPTGTTVDLLRTTGGTDVLAGWIEIPSGGYVETTNLTQGERYTIYVRDVWQQSGETGVNDTSTLDPNVVERQVWAFHVAVTNPFEDGEDINTTTGTDGGGKYVTVSNYTTVVPWIDLYGGAIEMSVHLATEIPTVWYPTANDGSPVKIYHNLSGTLAVTVRQRFGYIVQYDEVTDTFTQ